MTIAAGIELPEAEIVEICRRHEVRELSLFGSAARGEMRPDSDIDFLVDFLPGARPGLLGVAAMMRELTAVLGRPADPHRVCSPPDTCPKEMARDRLPSPGCPAASSSLPALGSGNPKTSVRGAAHRRQGPRRSRTARGSAAGEARPGGNTDPDCRRTHSR